MNSLRVEGVFWRIVNQIDPDFMTAQYSYDPCKRTASATKNENSRPGAFINPCMPLLKE